MFRSGVAAFLGISNDDVGVLELGGGGPVKPGLPMADLTSGLWVAIGILSALNGRHETGKGCQIDFSMLDGQVKSNSALLVLVVL